MNAILIAGAALVGLPILLHLIMKQEPKRLSFPAFRFLTQKLKTNQRKLRLRHFILLALRMLLIALFCLTLYQPTLKSDRLNIRGEQPIATVIVFNGSVSLSAKNPRPLSIDRSTRSPQRKPTRMPCFTHVLTRHPVGVDSSGSAARTRPLASDSRSIAKTDRLSVLSADAPC